MRSVCEEVVSGHIEFWMDSSLCLINLYGSSVGHTLKKHIIYLYYYSPYPSISYFQSSIARSFSSMIPLYCAINPSDLSISDVHLFVFLSISPSLSPVSSLCPGSGVQAWRKRLLWALTARQTKRWNKSGCSLLLQIVCVYVMKVHHLKCCAEPPSTSRLCNRADETRLLCSA